MFSSADWIERVRVAHKYYSLVNAQCNWTEVDVKD